MNRYVWSIVCIILVNALFIDLCAQASQENQQQAVENKIRQQLGNNLELKHWKVVEVEEMGKGQATIEKSILKITAVTKEALYKPAGRNEKGQNLLRVSKPAGETVELQGFIIQAMIPGVIKQSPLQVVVMPGEALGRPKNQYPGHFQLAAQKTSQNNPPAKNHPPSIINQSSEAVPAERKAVPPSTPITKSPTEFDELLALYKKDGEVRGVDTSRQHSGLPVVLRDLKLTESQALSGTIHRPHQKQVNQFSMQSGGGQIILRVQAATPAHGGSRKDVLACQAEGGLLVARSIQRSRSGLRFALNAEENEKFQKNFDQKIAPWKFSGEYQDHFCMGGGTLFNIDTLKEVSASWVRSNSPIPVRNFPSRYMSAELGYLATTPPYGAYPADRVKTVEPKGRLPMQPISSTKHPTWISHDMSEYVALRAGDLWHGKIDWPGNMVKQERNITNLGMLNDLKPIAWYRNDFYFYNRSNADKPILRINVQTGDIDELLQTKALHRNSHGSPDGRFIFFSDGASRYLPSGVESRLYVYDCQKRQSFTMDATIDERIYIGAMKEESRALKIVPRQWLSSSLFISEIGWYDLEKRERQLFIEAQGVVRERPEHFFRTVSYNFLPVADYVDITVQSYVEKQKKEQLRRYRVHRPTNIAIELPMEFEGRGNSQGNISWVDENRYVFSRKTGSIKEIGTWLYDVRTKTKKKLTPLFSSGPVLAENCCIIQGQKATWHFPVFFTNQHLVFPDKERIVYSVQKGNAVKLLSVPLDGGKIVEVPLSNRLNRMRRLLPFSIELPNIDMRLSQ